MTFSTFSLRRFSCLLLALLMLLCHVPTSVMADAQSPLVFALTWMEGDTPMEVQSTAVSASGYEGSYWLHVPYNALAANAALEIRDTYAQYESFSVASGTPLSQLFYSDVADLGGEALQVTCFANGQVANVIRLYISSQSMTPVTPAPVPVTTTVPVYYVDQNGNTLYSTSATVTTGNNAVYADDSILPEYNRSNDGRSAESSRSSGCASTQWGVMPYKSTSFPPPTPSSSPKSTSKSNLSPTAFACS